MWLIVLLAVVAAAILSQSLGGVKVAMAVPLSPGEDVNDELPLDVTVKPGVDLSGVQWNAMRPLVLAVLRVWQAAGASSITITSGVEGNHPGRGATSLHPLGLALDFRTYDAPSDVKTLARDVLDQLGSGYDLIVESDHLHGEYDGQWHTQIGVISNGAVVRV